MKKVNMLSMAKQISTEVEIVGLREGEKIDEELVSSHELEFASAIEDDYVILTPCTISRGEDKLHEPISSGNATKYVRKKNRKK